MIIFNKIHLLFKIKVQIKSAKNQTLIYKHTYNNNNNNKD